MKHCIGELGCVLVAEPPNANSSAKELELLRRKYKYK